MKKLNLLIAGTIVAAFLFSPTIIAQTGDDLITAVVHQDLEKVKELIGAGVDINSRDRNYKSTALVVACQYGLTDIAKYLIENGADINLQAESGHTPLMAAATVSEELLDLLLSKGADPLVELDIGTSAFTLLVTGILMERMPLESADKLLAKGANVDEAARSGATEGYTCLMMAARNQRPDLVKYLADKGANVNARTADGNTPLILANKEEDQEMVDLLKSLGAK